MSALGTLRVATAGSVDDGKSTLIGRLLHDTKTVFEDQLAAVTKASRRYGDGETNLALLTDGLRAEREQGITIDVAHRYFATPRRSFIVADTPGHAQYTRNMVTGASTADVAIVLVDARHGVVEQTRRHAFIAALLGVRAIALAVNKMDLVDWDEGTFDLIRKEVAAYIEALPTPVPLVAFPISALHGDNLVEASARSPWFDGPTLLRWLEDFDVDDAEARTAADAARVDVQRVIRPHGSDFRGYAGRLSGRSLAVGDTVVVAPSGKSSVVSAIGRLGRDVAVAHPGDAVVVSLADDIDISRGDTLLAGTSLTSVGPATTTDRVTVQLCWMIDEPLRAGARVWFKHGTRTGSATVTALRFRHDLQTLEPVSTDGLGLNDLGEIDLELSEPIAAQPYTASREGGRMILVDIATNTTAAAAMVVAG
jgi:sulfate adenylyltransferase large subunit